MTTTVPTTLITGCSTGIGHATARRFLAGGHRVIATMRNPTRGNDLAAAGAEVVALDVTDSAAIDRVIADVEPVDVLVNNAGVGHYGAIETMPETVLRATFEANVFAAVAMIRAVLPGMRQHGRGAIVNVSSVMGRLPIPVSGAYAASKAAIEAISEALVLEVADFGIRVAVVAPGFIRSQIAISGRPNSQLRPDSPYASLESHLIDRNTAGVAAGDDPAVAADAIWAAAVADPPVYRQSPGSGAARLVEARRTTPDDQWFTQLRATLQLPTLARPVEAPR